MLPKSMMLVLTSEKREAEPVDDAAASAVAAARPYEGARLLMITRRENAR